MTRPLIALALSLVLATSGCAYFNTFHHAKKYYGDAQKQDKKTREKGEDVGTNTAELYRQSVERCKKLLEKYPTSKWRDDAMLLMAKAYYGRHDYDTAEQTLIDFGQEFPDSKLYPESRYWLGLTAFALEDYAEARRIWAALLETYPKFEDAENVQFQLARSYGEEGQIAPAVEACRTYLKNYPRGENVTLVEIDLARHLLDEGEATEAETVARKVTQTARNDLDRVGGQLLLGEALEEQREYEQALDVYVDAAILLDGDVYKGRMTEEQRDAMLRAQREQAEEDSLARAEGKPINRGQNQGRRNQAQRDMRDPKQRLLAQVMLREGQVLAKVGRPKDAIITFEQILREFPRSSYSAEAQYRIGYTQEVLLEDFDRAQRAYADVPNQGASVFRDEALRRARNLDTVKSLLASSANDTLSEATAAAAEAKFMRAELYLFQQEKPERALEEYGSIEEEFAGTDYAAKAGLATAWLLQNTMGDSLASLEKYREVAAAFPNSEYGRRATHLLEGPQAEPELLDFAGPTLTELTDPLNLAVVAPDTGSVAEETPPTLATTAPPASPPALDPSPGTLTPGDAASLGAVVAATVPSGSGPGAAPGLNPGLSPGPDPSAAPGSEPAGGSLRGGVVAAGVVAATLPDSPGSDGLDPTALPPPPTEPASVAAGGGLDPLLPVPVEPPPDLVPGHLVEVPRDLYLDPLAVPIAEQIPPDASAKGGGPSPDPAPALATPTGRGQPSPEAIPDLDAPSPRISPSPRSTVGPPNPNRALPPTPEPPPEKPAEADDRTQETRKENPRATTPRKETPPKNVSPQKEPPKEEGSKEEGGSEEEKGSDQDAGGKEAPPDSSSGGRS